MVERISRSAALLFVAAAAPRTSASNLHKRINNNDMTNDITMLPLVPHREHLIRRERERRLELGFDAEILEEDVPRPHRYSRRLEDQQQVGALYQGYGTHYVDVWAGTPKPQRQTVIVDTGSGVTAFPCSGCTDCGESYHTDGYFIESESETFEQLDCSQCQRGRCSQWNGGDICRISMSYQEGSSWSAYEGRDWAYVGGPHDEPLDTGISITGGTNVMSKNLGDDPFHASAFAFRLVFGCQTSLTGLFKTQLADGIMGMDNGNTAFWKQMSGAGTISKNRFSLCFSRQSIASRDGTMAGALTMGGVDPRLHESPMVYASNVRDTGFYTVKLRKVYLRAGGGESAKTDDLTKVRPINLSEGDLNSGGVIVDSGTTDTYFTSRLAAPFKEAWRQIVGTEYTHSKIALTAEQLQALPTILFQLHGDPSSTVSDPASVTGLAGKLDPANPTDVVIAMPATHYMEYSPKEDVYTARFYLEEGSGSVLGANTMMGHDVHFDVDNRRIGIAESRCDYFELTGKEPGSVIDDIDGDGGSCSWWCIFLIIIAIIGAAICGCLLCKHFGDKREKDVDEVPQEDIEDHEDMHYPEDHEDARFVNDNEQDAYDDGVHDDVHDDGVSYRDDDHGYDDDDIDEHDGEESYQGTVANEGVGYSNDPRPPRLT